MTKAGFVSLIGRPNAGKSTLMNSLLGENIAMVSQKANATRKRSNAIVMFEDTQIIFVDTPGIHEREKILNQDKLFKKIASYNQYGDEFEALIPVSVSKKVGHKDLLNIIAKYLPESPYLYDPQDLTSELVRDIYAGFIREAIFENVSDEIPYESDVLIDSIQEDKGLDSIYATIIIEKESQKGIIIGKSGSSIKRISSSAREKIERLSGKKTYLNLEVVVKKGWSKDKSYLEEIGYIS